MRFFLAFILFSACAYLSDAQDTLVLLNGKTIPVKNVELGGYTAAYRTAKPKSRLKHIDYENMFSIKYADGTERIIYQPDSTEQGDYSIEQMRLYIRGEQDAKLYYKNNANKWAAFAFGGGISYFGFYGILGPAIYSTVVGSSSPDMSKQKVSDPALLQFPEYVEGYQRKVRDKKIKNSIIAGLAGFAVGVATFSIITRN